MVVWSSVLVVVAGCSPPLKPLGLADGCQPLLGGADCFLPYPSDFYRVEDANGAHLAVTGAAVQRTTTGVPMDVTRVRPTDGDSTIPTLVAMFPEAVVADGFVRLEDGGDPSLSPDTSNTLIVEAGTDEPGGALRRPRRARDRPKRKAIVCTPSSA